MAPIRPSSETKPHYMKSMFGRIASRYDLLNTVMTGGRHHAWRSQALRWVNPRDLETALDVGCGTADFALALSRYRVKHTVGLDIARPMLDVGQEKLTRQNMRDSIDLVVGDASRLPFPDASFDITVTAFTLRNVPDVELALSEMLRVTRPGGRMVSLDIVKRNPGILDPILRIYFHRIMPLLGSLVAGDREAYTYLPDSVDAFLSTTELSNLMERVGFKNVRSRNFALGTVAIHMGET
ncbi:MAG: ubiquinone/menaquinone biosynthesis methyltransferase [SAR202 cluster bacterium]|nr:ubiquinone/menaquinone biosynthesis methyltransferase [SAR202 cluster bacterium]